MKLRLALAAATCLALPVIAHAQPVTGPYVGLEAGTSISNPVNYHYTTERYYGKDDTKPSYAGIASVGYGFGNGFRVQLDGVFDRNTFHKDDYEGDYDYRIRGGENTFGPMVNVLYDFNVGLPVVPYVGVGAGYQWVQLNSSLKDYSSPEYMIQGNRSSFAYDVVAGASYPIAAVPGLSLTGEYRFTGLTESRNYSTSYYDEPAEKNYWGKVKFGQQGSDTFLLGLRYQIFNAPVAAPAPAPMAAPAPAEARTYLVFFDWDKYNLTPRATQIIAQAAADSKTQTTTTLDVSGYTDTSGTPVYNQGLSLRRAKAVAAKLVVDGVPAAEIEIHAYGETHLLVPTGPGVREPQNRRVEIVLN